MGSLLALKDSQTNIFWKKNIFRMEKFIILESIILIILSFDALLSFPFSSLKLVRQRFLIEYIMCYIFCFSLIAFISSLLIKYIHIQKTIKPNYRLCLMNFCGHIGVCSFFLSCILSFYINLVIMEWEDITGIIAYRRLASGNRKIVISFWRAAYTLIWNYFILICSLCGLFDFLMEINFISKASKYLSEVNNINNQNILFELFRMPIIKNNINNLEKTNILDNSNINNIEKKQKSSKFRIIMSNDNNDNYFENENNKFRQVEIIQKIEYKSIGVQTENSNNNYYNNYLNGNNEKIIDEDLSNNFILVKNKPLIDSKNSINDILNAPLK